jgi:hypothetical protein
MSDDPIETPSEPKPKRKKEEQSQLVELFLHVADLLGYTSDRDVAELAGVSPENVANWRSGAVQEFKQTKLKSIKASLAAQIGALKEQSGAVSKDAELDLCALEIERGSSPTDLQRQFRDQVAYDYLGHRFLYYEPMGALAWENLIRKGYDQERWVSSVDTCAASWLDTRRESDGRVKGAIADVLGLGKRNMKSGLDLISLGPGEGGKELAILRRLLEALGKIDQRLSWTVFAPVDVSIPLLLSAATEARRLLASGAKQGTRAIHQVKAFCADFEEGELRFLERLPTTVHPDQPSTRLVLMLGNVFGNLRDEETFVRQRLWRMARPGDLVWLEVGLRLDPLESDPLFRMTTPNRDETAAEANRRLLLEGPYRRWEAATGRSPAPLEMRVGIREDDETCRVPGSCNFCHDLVIKDERRVCTMLYSRRYKMDALSAWFERLDFEVLRVQRADDSRDRPRVGHLLLRRR